MRKRAEALRRYANILESMLERCQREHGGIFHDGQSYLQFRPPDADGAVIPDDPDFRDSEDLASSSDGDDTVAELCVPTQNLKLEDRDLVFYGTAAPFRFVTESPSASRSVPISSEIDHDSSARYVLMVDGVDESNYNPDFDWSRYLPPQVPLDHKEHDRILDLLFKFFTCWCMRIVPDLFLRDMFRFLSVPCSQTPPKTAHYSPMLHNALLAVATAFSDNPVIRDYRSRKYFAEEAKRLLESECQKPNVSVVHALSMLGSFHSSSGDQGLGYVYFGISARVSQALGLSVDCSAWVRSGLITLSDMHDRNWAYWTTFSQEICWCLYVGRDFSVVTPSGRQSIPVPYVDTNYDQVPWHHPSANIPAQPNYLFSTFAASCELLMIARRVMDVINTLPSSGAWRNDERISSIDLQLHAWKRRLPPEVDITLANKTTSTPHRLMTHLAFWWIFILLHRPFFHRRKRNTLDREIDHVKLCRRAAENIMDLLDVWRSLYTLRYVPITLIQVVFAAGTIFILLSVQATTGLRVAKKDFKTFLSQAELCIQYLTEIGGSFKCASGIADILRNLLHEQVKPVVEKRAVSMKKHLVPTSRSALFPDARTPSSESPPPPPHVSPMNALSSEQTLAGLGLSSEIDYPFDGDPFLRTSFTNDLAISSPYLMPSNSTTPEYDIFENSVSYLVGTFNPSSMETSGLFAMLGGEAIPDTPFIPPFSASGSFMSNGFQEQFSPLGATSSPDKETDMMDLQDADYAALEQFLAQAQHNTN